MRRWIPELIGAAVPLAAVAGWICWMQAVYGPTYADATRYVLPAWLTEATTPAPPRAMPERFPGP